MSDPLPRDPGRWLRPCIYVTLIIIAVVAAGLILRVSSTMSGRSPKFEARIAATSLTAALQMYYSEYGHWPDFTGNGLFLDEQRQARLLRVLMGKDEANNPSKIVFFEARIAIESFWKYRSGIHPKTDTLLDPWGQPYRIALDLTGIGTIANFYPDDGPIHSTVIVWSLGKDGQQGSPANPHTFKGSDDVTSWQ